MKISYAIILSILCSPFLITSASAKCTEGKPASGNRCVLEKTVSNPCKKGFYSHKHQDCSVCEEESTYDCQTQTCVKKSKTN